MEAAVPSELRKRLTRNGDDASLYEEVRYEVAIGLGDSDTLTILGETLWLTPGDRPASHQPGPKQLSFFPQEPEPPEYVALPESHHAPSGWRRVVSKKASSGNDYFQAETTKWNNLFRFGAQKLALANLPEDEDRFPVGTWFKSLLAEGTQRIVLDSRAMREPAPTGSGTAFLPDGSNLPRVIEALRQDKERFGRWIAHIQTALPDIDTIDVRERPEDRRRYLVVTYHSGQELPSWAVSDGTLRLLALTLLAYAPIAGSLVLVEEPENGIHPQAVETVFQSLSSARDRQILCASHSPVVLSMAEPPQILCFATTPEGATDIVRGDHHPRLRDWQGEVDLGTLFGAGVLG